MLQHVSLITLEGKEDGGLIMDIGYLYEIIFCTEFFVNVYFFRSGSRIAVPNGRNARRPPMSSVHLELSCPHMVYLHLEPILQILLWAKVCVVRVCLAVTVGVSELIP